MLTDGGQRHAEPPAFMRRILLCFVVLAQTSGCMIGLRPLGSEWRPVEALPTIGTHWAFGLSAGEELGKGTWAVPVEVFFSQGTVEGAEAYIDELSVGVWVSPWARGKWVHPWLGHEPFEAGSALTFCGGGLTYAWVELDDGAREEDRGLFGAYAHCGYLAFSRDIMLGVELRLTLGTGLGLGSDAVDADGVQLMFHFATSGRLRSLAQAVDLLLE